MKFLAIIFLLFFKFTFLTYANEVVYIDMSYILSNSNHGKSILDELEKKNKNNIKELALKEKIIKDLEIKISNQRNILSKNEFEKKINDLKSKVKVFRNDKDKLVKEFNNLKNNEIKNFMKNVEPLVSEYIKTNSINIVLDKKNVIIGKKDLDITYEILEVVNKNIK